MPRDEAWVAAAQRRIVREIEEDFASETRGEPPVHLIANLGGESAYLAADRAALRRDDERILRRLRAILDAS
jgi:hypothetical protein